MILITDFLFTSVAVPLRLATDRLKFYFYLLYRTDQRLVEVGIVKQEYMRTVVN